MAQNRKDAPMERKLLILSGPSGVGKDTVAKKLFESDPRVEKCVSATTRKPRPGEVDGVAYHFMSHDEFEQEVAQGHMLEHQNVHGNYYGTPVSEIERISSEGHVPVLIIDPKGAAEVKRNHPDATSIFIEPPSVDVLRQRLLGRGTETPEQAERRLGDALEQLSQRWDYDYRIVNDDLEDTVRNVSNVIDAELQGDKVIRNIVLTGGPCAGKTSALSRLTREFSERGWAVIIVPEAATHLFNSNISFAELGTEAFQQAAMDLQTAHEDIAERAAQAHPSNKVMILHDRGISDQAAFMPQQLYQDLLEQRGMTVSDVFSRYDTVIHLRSAAIGAEQAYTTANNAARTEDLQGARDADARIISQWAGHPHLLVIENHGDFSKKLDDLVDTVSTALGDHLRCDAQKKYLVEMPSQEWFDSCETHAVQTVITGYLDTNDGRERRVRATQTNGSWSYAETTKVETGDATRRLTTERVLSKHEFEDLMEQATSSNTKTRHAVVVDGQSCVIDQWPGSPDLAIMETRAISEQTTQDVPRGLVVVKDVTNDMRFRNSHLAADHASPADTWSAPAQSQAKTPIAAPWEMTGPQSSTEFIIP